MGRCNFTNLYTTPEQFISHNPHFCKSALSRYTPADFIALVEKHRIPFHEKTRGQLFCDQKSKAIQQMLLSEVQAANVSIHLNESIQSIQSLSESLFSIVTNQSQYQAKSLVVATGGLSIPTLGASPFGYEIAQQFGLTVHPVRAGLVPFTYHPHDKQRLEGLSGHSVPCCATVNGVTFDEDMLFTHRGLSGPAMLQVSSYWQPGDTVNITCLPDHDLLALIREAQQRMPNVICKNVLKLFFSMKHMDAFLSDSIKNTPVAQLNHQALAQVVDTFQRWVFRPNNTEGYRTAEVTLGGVDCDALSSKTMESRDIKGLYFIGEVVDVTGWLGGV